MSMQDLPAEWRNWIEENVARGCSRESMLPMLLGGGFTADVAEPALAEAFGRKPVPRPGVVPDGSHGLVCNGHTVRLAVVLSNPRVLVFDKLLTAQECDELIALAQVRMEPSTVIDDQSGTAVPHADRTSAGASFQRGEFELLTTLEARIAILLSWPVENGEGLQVLRYAPGSEYKAHFDYFDPAKLGSAEHLAQGGQRVGTLIIYLCDVEAGGSTRFPSLGLEVRPRQGSGVFFADVDATGDVDPRTLHAGAPVISGVKVIATKWLRERPYGSTA
jgi:prolyl 4-hydroxylase